MSDIARTKDWWDELTPQEQSDYLKEHPASKLAATAKSRPETQKTWLRKGMVDAGDRSSLPDHIKALKLPPGWKKLQYNPDPQANLIAIGLDQKNRDQYVYSEKFISVNQAMKFARIREMDDKFESMLDQTRHDQKSENRSRAEHALVAELIFSTGIRPGSNEDTGAEKKAYGATTLQARHLVEDENGLSLQFTGKKGVDLNIPITDESLKQKLLARAKSLSPDDKLFSVSDSSLRDYVKTLDGGSFKTKDLRTSKAGRLARSFIASMDLPKTEKEYKSAVLTVARYVAKKLGNTPQICLVSYIDPLIWIPLKDSAGVQ